MTIKNETAEARTRRSSATSRTADSKSPCAATMNIAALPEQLKELRLPTIRELHSMTAEQAARDQWTHLQFLSELASKECDSRQANRIVRLMKDAHLLPGKTWQQFQWSRLPLHVTQQFELLRSGSFLNRQDNLLLFGKPGSGKTNLLSALGDQLVRQGRSVYFTTCQSLVQNLLRAKRDLRLERYIKTLSKFEALIIDDLGYVQQSREEMEVLFTLLSLPQGQWSFLLQEHSQMLAVDQAYDQAMNNLGEILGGNFSVDTAEKNNAELGTAAGDFLSRLPDPLPESEAKLLVVQADCKGVPLVKEDSAKVAAFETAKKNPRNRRMATAAAAYTVDSYVRTAEDITAALFREERDESEEKIKRPRPQNKNTTAHFPEIQDNGDGSDLSISGIHVAMAWIMGQVAARRRRGQVLIVLMDGQESLWQTMMLHLSFGPRTVPILDILHALAYVWEASKLFSKDDATRKAFTRERLLRILRGEVRGVIKGLRRLGTTKKLTGEAKKDLFRICNYLEKNADRMRYDEYLRRGYPIASGVIEGACRHLVKDRMERSGMRWTLEGARSMLNVRAAFQSDHWRGFLDDQMQREIESTHRHRELMVDYQAYTLAC